DPNEEDMHMDDREIQTYVDTLKGYTPAQIEQAFAKVQAANEITPFQAKGNDGNLSIRGWRLTKETARAEALITWYNNHVHVEQQSNSPSIHPRRSTRTQKDDGLFKEVNQTNQ
ncbi:hypothetical protein CU098_009041, partial [Rhizopus stolonifer]